MDAWNRGDVAAMVAHATPDSEYVIAEQNPAARVLHGREEIAAYLEDWLETLHELHYEVGELLEAGDAIVSIGTMTGRAGEGGPEITAELAFVLHFEGTQVFAPRSTSTARGRWRPPACAERRRNARRAGGVEAHGGGPAAERRRARRERAHRAREAR